MSKPFQRKAPKVPADSVYEDGDIRVERRDFVRRSTVRLFHTGDQGCGTTTFHCPIEQADVYEAGLREHVCKVEPGGLTAALESRPAFRRMLEHMAAPILGADR